MTTRQDCVVRDRHDPLAPLREQFHLPDGVIYLDGNSLGVRPKATTERMQQVLHDEWGTDLIRSWNTAGWIHLPQRVGNKIARLVGAGENELVVADSTSVNLYKVLSAAARIQRERDPQRRAILSERSNFPTDLYIAESLCKELGWTLRLLEADEVESHLGPEVAVLMLTQVNYRTGRMFDMARLTAAAHAAGVLAVWDLCHSAGAVPVDLKGADADFAIGCGYKYLNGGPGAPAFVWVHPRHADAFSQPLSGWMGHAAPFEFIPHYQPAPGIARYLCGTPPILSMAALECGVDTVLAAEAHGGMAALRAKSVELTELFAQLVEERCAGHGLSVVSPRDAAQRGSQVCLTRSEGGYAIVQALIARGVIGDFRAGDSQMPDILRFGFTPLYTRYVDVWDAVEHLREVMESGEWQRPEFNRRHAVT
ncbi:kynureninase [Caldimonas thermodepolymerans]|uniref:Kynureninase n=1 Tax=Caldimonas thermodepolymerans TaxID=215580 RepID=A0A2S5SZS1_9BURK|nr:kynureninase [Caldimonas thermodepolymerans]PPE68275.1 kynureninase [Caldimonas thermodepolymerans]QPC32714.1 kynureninase [Caldimonas thermodepolymerans]RDI03475.1 kynureninase [Caldimonas thermodepolymerans]